MQNIIKDNFASMKSVLDEFSTGDNFEKISRAGELMAKSIAGGGQVIACGNGGSLSDSMHFAEELTGRFRKNRRPLPAVAITDPAYITCVANDFGYSQIFSRYVEAYGKEGDTLLAITTSGSSENVVEAARMAESKGMNVVSLTGKGGGVIGEHSDVEIRVPRTEFSDRAQEIHIKVIHTLCQLIERHLGVDE